MEKILLENELIIESGDFKYIFEPGETIMIESKKEPDNPEVSENKITEMEVLLKNGVTGTVIGSTEGIGVGSEVTINSKGNQVFGTIDTVLNEEVADSNDDEV